MIRRIIPVVVVALAAGLTVLMPAVVGMTWTSIAAVLTAVSVSTLVALTVLWLAGLVVHTMVLTASMPGLSHRRALLLNLSGSAVSNLLPFGAAGAGLNYVMTSAWGIPASKFASFTVISNLWNVLGRLLVGTALLSLALIAGVALPAAVKPGVVFAGVGALAALLAILIATVGSSRVSGGLGRGLDQVIGPLFARAGRTISVAAALSDVRANSSATIKAGWGRLTFGVLAYLLLQGLLMAACLAAVGAHAAPLVVAVAFGIDRLISSLPLTPGGAGLAEIGTAVALVALGVDPVTAAAGVLLYRLFTFLLEIPLGGAFTLAWLGHHRHRTLMEASA